MLLTEILSEIRSINWKMNSLTRPYRFSGGYDGHGKNRLSADEDTFWRDLAAKNYDDALRRYDEDKRPYESRKMELNALFIKTLDAYPPQIKEQLQLALNDRDRAWNSYQRFMEDDMTTGSNLRNHSGYSGTLKIFEDSMQQRNREILDGMDRTIREAEDRINKIEKEYAAQAAQRLDTEVKPGQ